MIAEGGGNKGGGVVVLVYGHDKARLVKEGRGNVVFSVRAGVSGALSEVLLLAWYYYIKAL